ncbi:MAG: hypothetical protein IPF46_17900 [Saprospiraceae bacterium]|nr:hypothetical protein [Candidatus Vicinibacter affinis]MBK7799234.1 hypothetical protein [Candidatus Vicinibacter affinis]
MKKLKQSFQFYLSLIIFSIFITCCCEYSSKIVGNGKMYIHQIDNGRSDTIRSKFEIELILETRVSGNFHNTGIISSSYATSCSETALSTLTRNSFKLICENDFIYKGQLIKAGTNFKDEENLIIEFDNFSGVILIHFGPEFLNSAKFEKSIHKFRVEIETSDQEKFTNEASTYMDM